MSKIQNFAAPIFLKLWCLKLIRVSFPVSFLHEPLRKNPKSQTPWNKHKWTFTYTADRVLLCCCLSFRPQQMTLKYYSWLRKYNHLIKKNIKIHKKLIWNYVNSQLCCVFFFEITLFKTYTIIIPCQLSSRTSAEKSQITNSAQTNL